MMINPGRGRAQCQGRAGPVSPALVPAVPGTAQVGTAQVGTAQVELLFAPLFEP